MHYRKTIETDDHTMIITDFVSGRNLEAVLMERLENGFVFSEAQVAHIARHLLEALSYCHEQGVMHRDVKPENVILGEDGLVTLIDFGMAEFTNETSCEPAGTPYYMAPEMLESEYAESCDVWSLGVLVYYLLTG